VTIYRNCIACNQPIESEDRELCDRPECIIERETKKGERKKKSKHERARLITDSELAATPTPVAEFDTEQGVKMFGTKALTHVTPVLPTSDTAAPFGRDPKTDRPLKPIDNRALHRDLSARELDRLPIDKRCVHRNDPSTCGLCKQPDAAEIAQRRLEKEIPKPEPRPVERTPEQQIKDAKRNLGIVDKKASHRYIPPPPSTSAPWYTSPKEQERHMLQEKKKKPIEANPHFLNILGLEQEILLSWLEIQSVRQGHPGEFVTRYRYDRVEKPSSVDIEAAAHKKRIQDAEEEVREMESHLADALNPDYDGGLSPQKRAGVIRGLRTSIKKRKIEIGGMKRRKFKPQPIEFVYEPLPDSAYQVFEYPKVPIPADDIRCYREVVNLTRPFSDEWRKFENEVIKRAISAEVYCPLPEFAKGYSELFSGSRGTGSSAPRDAVDTLENPETALIIKTGGGAIGGSIISAGTEPDGSLSELSSFDGSGVGIHRNSGPSDSADEGSPDYDPSDDTIE
jgi:hypothetical protein